MALFILSLAVGVLYLCRLDGLTVWTHKPEFLVFYSGLFIAVCFAGLHAWIGVWDAQDWAVLVAAMAHIASSFSTWKNGPPKWAER